MSRCVLPNLCAMPPCRGHVMLRIISCPSASHDSKRFARVSVCILGQVLHVTIFCEDERARVFAVDILVGINLMSLDVVVEL